MAPLTIVPRPTLIMVKSLPDAESGKNTPVIGKTSKQHRVPGTSNQHPVCERVKQGHDKRQYHEEENNYQRWSAEQPCRSGLSVVETPSREDTPDSGVIIFCLHHAFLLCLFLD
jgi:hypothetical protein